MFKTKYRVNRDRILTWRWCVQAKHWWWPFWVTERALLQSKEDAFELKSILESQQQYTPRTSNVIRLVKK